jgi:hypothetical protein
MMSPWFLVAALCQKCKAPTENPAPKTAKSHDCLSQALLQNSKVCTDTVPVFPHPNAERGPLSPLGTPVNFPRADSATRDDSEAELVCRSRSTAGKQSGASSPAVHLLL